MKIKRCMKASIYALVALLPCLSIIPSWITNSRDIPIIKIDKQIEEQTSPSSSKLNKLITINNGMPLDYPIDNKFWYPGAVCCAGNEGILYCSRQ